jgi:hypothetical protein
MPGPGGDLNEKVGDWSSVKTNKPKLNTAVACSFAA